MDDFGDKIGGVFNAYIGRVVAFVLAPLLVVVVPPVVDGLNTVLGTDFSNQEISNMAIATIVGLALVVYKWLHNRGEWENKLAELHMLYESGKEYVNQVDEADQSGTDTPKPVGAVAGKPGLS